MTSQIETNDQTTIAIPQRLTMDVEHAHIRVKDIVAASGSSFFWAMRLLPKARRRAIFAVYAFCRQVDDIVDEDGQDKDKLIALNTWRRAIAGLYETPQAQMQDFGKDMNNILLILSEAIQTYELEEVDFQAVIDGMEMDAHGPVTLNDMETLNLYCDRVASAVGRLCVPIFGQADAKGREVANHLGQALQLTNIIRDVPEDAEIKRLYLPQDLLANFGIENQSPEAVAQHSNLPKACAALGMLAEERFDKAKLAISKCDAHAMRAPRVMMNVYYQNLKRLRSKGWQPHRLRQQGYATRIWRKFEKLLIGLRYGFF